MDVHAALEEVTRWCAQQTAAGDPDAIEVDCHATVWITIGESAPPVARALGAPPLRWRKFLALGVLVVSVVSRFPVLEGLLGRSGRFVTRWMLPRCCRAEVLRFSRSTGNRHGVAL
jgi:hypothetical protein